MVKLLVVIALVAAVALFLTRRRATAPIRRARAEYRDLLQMVGGHRPTADRLIDAERRRRPHLSRAAAARSARKRIEADRR